METQQVWKSWRDEQFARAAATQKERLQARVQLAQETRDQLMKTMSNETTTQLSTPTLPMDRSLTTLPMPKPPKATTCIMPLYELEELTDHQSTGA